MIVDEGERDRIILLFFYELPVVVVQNFMKIHFPDTVSLDTWVPMSAFLILPKSQKILINADCHLNLLQLASGTCTSTRHTATKSTVPDHTASIPSSGILDTKVTITGVVTNAGRQVHSHCSL